MGGGQRRNRPGQRPVQDLEALRRREILATTEVGRTAGPPVADEELGSEASEWEKIEREEYLA